MMTLDFSSHQFMLFYNNGLLPFQPKHSHSSLREKLKSTIPQITRSAAEIQSFSIHSHSFSLQLGVTLTFFFSNESRCFFPRLVLKRHDIVSAGFQGVWCNDFIIKFQEAVLGLLFVCMSSSSRHNFFLLLLEILLLSKIDKCAVICLTNNCFDCVFKHEKVWRCL